MTYAPPTLTALGNLWTARGGVNLGVVGDTRHQMTGISYHLGKDLLNPDAYSIRTARDKAGLTGGASAIDLGKLNGSLPQLRKFSEWLVKEAQAQKPGTSDIREIIYSPDGVVVMRWDRERGAGSAPRPNEADATHLTHTHVSFYRDAEARDHRTAFAPYFEVQEPEMTNYRAIGEDWKPSVRPDAQDAPVRLTPDRAAPIAVRLPAGAVLRTVGEFEQGGEAWRITRLPDGRTGFLIRGDLAPVTAGGDPTVDAPYLAYVQRKAATDCAAAVKAERDRVVALGVKALEAA